MFLLGCKLGFLLSLSTKTLANLRDLQVAAQKYVPLRLDLDWPHDDSQNGESVIVSNFNLDLNVRCRCYSKRQFRIDT